MKKSLINVIVGLSLFILALYLVSVIPQTVEGDKIVLNTNDEYLWIFLSFIPVIMLMIIGGLSIINGIYKFAVLSIMTIVLNVALIIFIKIEPYFFVSIVKEYKELMNYVLIASAAASLLILIDLVFFRKKPKKKQKTSQDEA